MDNMKKNNDNRIVDGFGRMQYIKRTRDDENERIIYSGGYVCFQEP